MRKVTPTAMIKVLESKRHRCLHMHHGSKRGLKQTLIEREREPQVERGDKGNKLHLYKCGLITRSPFCPYLNAF
jgi:hypothetical protein